MKYCIALFTLFAVCKLSAQAPVDLSGYNAKSGTTVSVKNGLVNISWPSGKNEQAKLVLNLAGNQPLFQSMQLTEKGQWKEIAGALDPEFILTIGKRDLVSQNGWNIFFDKTAYLPHTSYRVQLNKQREKVIRRWKQNEYHHRHCQRRCIYRQHRVNGL